MHLRLSIVVAALLRASSPLPAQQSYGFVTRLGRDTISVERVTRTADRLIGDGVQRYPRTTIRHYDAQLAPDGTVRRMVIDNALPADPRGSQHVVIDFGPDSARVTIGSAGPPVENTIPTHGILAMPIVESLYGPYEQLLLGALARRADSIPVIFVTGDVLPPGVNPSFVRRLPRDSAMLSWLGSPFMVQVTATGGMTSFDGDRTTRKVHVERLDVAPDLALIGARFAAAEKSAGGAAPVLSVRDTVTARIGAASVMIDYGRPLARGRVILGNVVPFDSVWRTGANEATQLRTTAPITIAGMKLPAGIYSLWTIPTRNGAVLILNEESGQWGVEYHPSRDVGRVALAVETPDSPVERFTIRLESAGSGAARLVLEWDRFRWTAAIKAP